MDPLSALSVAAAVLQFVDFGTRLLSTSYEIYKSPFGETAKEVELSTVTNDLAGLVAHVKDAVEVSKAEYHYRSVAETQLVGISQECEEIVAQFRKALDIFKGREINRVSQGKQNNGRRSSLSLTRGAPRAALASIWNASKVDAMINRLENLKRRMTTATLFCLW